jgi:glycosyltransferase involved in cell wall biosynthesis
LLILLNPGNFTRHYLVDMAGAAKRLGIRVLTLEIGDIWSARQAGRSFDAAAFASLLREHNVRAVLSSSLNGLLEFPTAIAGDGRPRPFFEQLGILHLMWWTDHPQWANERIGLREDLQPLLRSPNSHYFVKSQAAALEVRHVLKWPNCHGLPVAENPERLQPVVNAKPDFDVVCVVGSPPNLDPALESFLDNDDPDVAAIHGVLADKVAKQLDDLWRGKGPKLLLTSLTQFGKEWTQARRQSPFVASFRLFQALAPAHLAATQWLLANHGAYFDALEILWQFGQWRRAFYIRYLAKYFRVGVLGADWSSVGSPGGGWVNHDDQPAAYAKGCVALNISQAGDEEGIAHKPFQIAACGVSMAHIHAEGLSDCFEPGSEVAVFRTPREAREVIAALLDDPDGRARMADAARQRLCREHTWEQRLPQMLQRAGVGCLQDSAKREQPPRGPSQQPVPDQRPWRPRDPSYPPEAVSAG